MSSPALDEVYAVLEHHAHGDKYIAWYGQCRAEGMAHAEAIESAIERFDLRREPWWGVRFPEGWTSVVVPEKSEPKLVPRHMRVAAMRLLLIEEFDCPWDKANRVAEEILELAESRMTG